METEVRDYITFDILTTNGYYVCLVIFFMLIIFVINVIIITAGLSIRHRDSSPGRDLEEILQELRTARVNNEGRTIVNVRRGHIWEDSCRCLQRKRFSPGAIISVCFADDFGNSEGAVDIGGPRREFHRLLVKAANEHSGIFGGPADRRVLVPNSNGKSQRTSSSTTLALYACIAWR